MQGLFPFIGVEEGQARGLFPVALQGAEEFSELSFPAALLEAMGPRDGPTAFSSVSARTGPPSLAWPVVEVLGERRPLGVPLPRLAETGLSRLESPVPGFPTEGDDASEAGQEAPVVALGSLVAPEDGKPLVLMLRPQEGRPPVSPPAGGQSGAFNVATGTAAGVVLRAPSEGADLARVSAPTRELLGAAFRLVAPDDSPAPGTPAGEVAPPRPLPLVIDGFATLGEQEAALTLVGSFSGQWSSIREAPGAASGLPSQPETAGGKPYPFQVKVELPVGSSPEATTGGAQQTLRAVLSGVDALQPLLERLGATEVKVVSLSGLKQEAPQATGQALPFKALWVPESGAVLLRFQAGSPEAAQPALLLSDTLPVNTPVAAGRTPAEGQSVTAPAQAAAPIEVDLLAPSLSEQPLRVWLAPSAGAAESPQGLSALEASTPTVAQLPQVTQALRTLGSASRGDPAPLEFGGVQPTLSRADAPAPVGASRPESFLLPLMVENTVSGALHAEPTAMASPASGGFVGQGVSVAAGSLEPEGLWERPPEATVNRQRIGGAETLVSEKVSEPVQPMGKPALFPVAAALPASHKPLPIPGAFGGQVEDASSTATVARPSIPASGEPEGMPPGAGGGGLSAVSPRPAATVVDPAHAGGTVGKPAAPMSGPAEVPASPASVASQPEGFHSGAVLEGEGYGWSAEGWPANAPSQAPAARAVLQPVRREEFAGAEPTADVSRTLPASWTRVGQPPTGLEGLRSDASPPVRDWQPVFERITRQVRAALPQGRGEMQLRLEPPQLGRLRLQVAVEEGRVTARFVTETEEAQAILRGRLSELQTALSESGLRVQEVKLTLAGHGDSWAADSGGFGRERQGLSHEFSRQAGTANGDAFSHAEERSSSSGHRQPSLRAWEALVKTDGRRIDYRV